MHTKLAATLAVIALLGGCNRKDEARDTGELNRDRAGVDTVVKAGTVRDTTVVKADTNVDVDTLKKTEHIKKDRK
jgi:ABC-type uncharacterized transport system auxiliary subunit